MKTILYLLLTILFLCIGCTEENISEKLFIDQLNPQTETTHKISKEEALEHALRVLNAQSCTRSLSIQDFTLDYITASRKIRSNVSNDTIAYIFNASNNDGFAIISADNIMSSVIAYSETGNFNQNIPVVKENFINILENKYLDTIILSSEGLSAGEISPIVKPGIQIYPPIIYKSIGQWAPYNKYVNAEHPGYPAGCVAIATAQIILYSTDTLNYHGKTFYSKSIREAFRIHENIDPPIHFGNNPIVPKYSYEEAIDTLARFLLDLSDDLKMDYPSDRKVSLANPLASRSLLINLGLNVKSQFKTFNIQEIIEYVRNGCIIYISGKDASQSSGHAFLADGVTILDSATDSQSENILLHIDWGWEGESNGYFSGEIFEAAYGIYTPKNYFAVKSLFSNTGILR